MERASFFQRQRVDAAGYSAVDLQKILITLMVSSRFDGNTYLIHLRDFIINWSDT
jgi:hypothetical protein